jgi:hypothetical protein
MPYAIRQISKTDTNGNRYQILVEFTSDHKVLSCSEVVSKCYNLNSAYPVIMELTVSKRELNQLQKDYAAQVIAAPWLTAYIAAPTMIIPAIHCNGKEPILRNRKPIASAKFIDRDETGSHVSPFLEYDMFYNGTNYACRFWLVIGDYCYKSLSRWVPTRQAAIYEAMSHFTTITAEQLAACDEIEQSDLIVTFAHALRPGHSVARLK